MNLTEPITTIKFVSESYERKLDKLGIKTIKDIITYFPRDYSDTSEVDTLSNALALPDLTKKYTFKLTVHNFQNTYLRSRKTFQQAKCFDETGEITCIWFNQPFLKNTFKPGAEVYVSGKLKPKGRQFQFVVSNYEVIIENRENTHLARIAPEYRLTGGVTKKWFRNRIKSVIDKVKSSEVLIPDELKENLNIERSISKDIVEVHFPDNWEQVSKSVHTLSELELIDIHLKVIAEKALEEKKYPVKVTADMEKTYEEFKKLLAFQLTTDQDKVILRFIELLKKESLINELIQGDVGTGKTAVAMFLAYLMAKSGKQTVILAPTTILAKQHFETFISTFGKKIKIYLATSETKREKNIVADVVIGTTAVLARKLDIITSLGLVIVDEQHRFGVSQREELLAPLNKILKNKSFPHFINMTATPIPRTIAETFFSDLEVSLIKTKPKGRLPIKSFLVPETKRQDSYDWVREQIKKEKVQVYWICSLIEESEILEAKSAKTLYSVLQKEFKEFKVGLIHGKLKPDEKIKIMEEFGKGKIDILVSTSVIEVGIDVANATIMMIENAERFGLAQLHQIRGRVGRGSKQSYCFFFYDDTLQDKALGRLKFIAKNNDGLEIAEFDLKTRGPGEVYGTKQAGIPDLKIAKLNDIKMIKEAKEKAIKLYKKGVRRITLFS